MKYENPNRTFGSLDEYYLFESNKYSGETFKDSYFIFTPSELQKARERWEKFGSPEITKGILGLGKWEVKQ